MKFALVSNILPPGESAHALIIYRLLKDLPADSYCLLSGRDYAKGDQPEYSKRLSGRYYHLPPTYKFTRGYRWGLQAAREWLNKWMELTLGFMSRVIRIASIMRRERCEAVVVCTGGLEVLDMPAAFVASLITRTRFYAYLLDQYAHMVAYVFGNNFLRHFEPWMMRRAAAVIVPNEFLAAEMRGRYGIEPKLIHNACVLSDYNRAPAEPNVEKVILYAGSISNLHHDCFRNLVAAINSLGRCDVRLHLYTGQPPVAHQKEGISGPVEYHDYVPGSEMPGIQRSADILFLPLAFNSPYPEIVRTAAPGKLGEFLAARRPILVHAPKDSFIAWYFREHDCGLVVDEDNPEELARALDRLLTDEELCTHLSGRAGEMAEADFDHRKAREQFLNVLGLNDVAV
jgi:glycosyltransferase involved in cell wall biosynthesis